MGGGAWPFLVGGVICLVYSDNERDFRLLVGLGGSLLIPLDQLKGTLCVVVRGSWKQ